MRIRTDYAHAAARLAYIARDTCVRCGPCTHAIRYTPRIATSIALAPAERSGRLEQQIQPGLGWADHAHAHAHARARAHAHAHAHARARAHGAEA